MNYIKFVKKGEVRIGRDFQQVIPDTFCFHPANREIFIKFGKSSHYPEVGRDGITNDDERNHHLKVISSLESWDQYSDAFYFVGFDVKLYNAISFFSILDLPQFTIPFDEEFAFLVKHICREDEQSKLGKKKLIENYTHEMVIHLCRYIESQPDLRRFVEKVEYLTDKRLVDIVKYIQENLNKDLSNKAIASVAYVSEDYVGQFFKSLTNTNLQDYIENQRLELALKLLKTRPDTIQEIAHQVGFRDPAYFSRRFKLKYGTNANASRSETSYEI